MRKKIMIFIPSLENGGAERVTSYLANHFADKYSVDLVTNYIGTCEYKLDCRVSRHVSNSIYENRKIVKKCRPDLIIVMFAPMSIFVVPAIQNMGIPYIISERNDPSNFAGKKITKLLYQYFMKKATGLVFQTSDAMNYYVNRMNVRGKKNIIWNPLHLTNFPDVCDCRKKEIVNVGRLHHQKNQKLLIDAFAAIEKNYPDYVLKIYGDGELKQDLKDYIENKNLENKVILMGNRKDVLECVKEAEIFVLSSDFEGMPNALIEAMALGLSVISTDCPCGGPRELISDRQNGLLVPTNNVNKLIDALTELLNNSELRKQIGMEAVKIRTKLDESYIMEQWENFCKEVMDYERKE